MRGDVFALTDLGLLEATCRAVAIEQVERAQITFSLADPYLLVLSFVGLDRCFIECCSYRGFHSAGQCDLGYLPYSQRLDECGRKQTDVHLRFNSQSLLLSAFLQA